MSLKLETTAVLAAPFTTGWQLQIGPGGACRLVVLGTADDAEAIIAVLELDTASADRLSRELAERQKSYDQRRKGQGGATH